MGEDWEAIAKQRGEELEALKTEYKEFTQSSAELEQALEDDLASARETEKLYEESERTLKDTKSKLARVTQEYDQYRTKMQEKTKEQEDTISSLTKELDELKQFKERSRDLQRKLENENDDLERKSRAIEATIADLQAREEKAIENGAWLQGELEEERAQHQEMTQRLKEDLRDMQQELVVRNGQLDILSRQGKTPTAQGSGSVMGGGVASPAPSAGKGTPSTPATPGSPSKSSLHIVNDMLGRVKSLEQRLAVCVSVCKDILPEDKVAKGN